MNESLFAMDNNTRKKPMSRNASTIERLSRVCVLTDTAYPLCVRNSAGRALVTVGLRISRLNSARRANLAEGHKQDRVLLLPLAECARLARH